MTAVTEQAADLLAGWLASESSQERRRRGRDAAATSAGGLRFAFCGRMSTAEYQDPRSSRQWQQDSASELIAAHGTIVAEFFDIGVPSPRMERATAGRRSNRCGRRS